MGTHIPRACEIKKLWADSPVERVVEMKMETEVEALVVAGDVSNQTKRFLRLGCCLYSIADETPTFVRNCDAGRFLFPETVKLNRHDLRKFQEQRCHSRKLEK
jgi:hypothetical protein